MSFDIELWCFSFVTLFNLQGTRPTPRSVRNTRYLTTVPKLCQVLFSTFFKIFFRTRSALGSVSEALLSYHTLANLSSTFFNFSQVFSALDPFARSRSESLISISRQLSFVKHFFRFPENFLPALRKLASVSDSLPNITDLPPFVNTFFQDF